MHFFCLSFVSFFVQKLIMGSNFRGVFQGLLNWLEMALLVEFSGTLNWFGSSFKASKSLFVSLFKSLFFKF